MDDYFDYNNNDVNKQFSSTFKFNFNEFKDLQSKEKSKYEDVNDEDEREEVEGDNDFYELDDFQPI